MKTAVNHSSPRPSVVRGDPGPAQLGVGLILPPDLRALEQLAPWKYEQEVGSRGRKQDL